MRENYLEAKNRVEAEFRIAKAKYDSKLAELQLLEAQTSWPLRQHKLLTDAITEAGCSGTPPKTTAEPASR